MLTELQVRGALERAHERFLETCTRVTGEQWCFQPDGIGDRSWTIAQVIEHVTSANEGLHRVLQRVTELPRDDRSPTFEDEDLPYIFYGGGGAPPPGLEEPSGLSGVAETIGGFRDSLQPLLDWYDAVEIDLRECAMVHPAFGLFDGAQWVLFAAVHMQQHRGQILDLQLAADAAASSIAT